MYNQDVIVDKEISIVLVSYLSSVICHREIILLYFCNAILFKRYIQRFLIHVFVKESPHFPMYLLAQTDYSITVILEFCR